jgi:hypothetical protein
VRKKIKKKERVRRYHLGVRGSSFGTRSLVQVLILVGELG